MCRKTMWHHFGLTGCAERTGEAILLVRMDKHKLLRDIERLLKRKIPRIVLLDCEPDLTIKAKLIINGQQGRMAMHSAGNSDQRENRSI